VSGWNILPHHLLNLKSLQLFDQTGPDKEADEKGGQNCIDRPEGDISKDIEKGVNGMKRIE
jgi:hypothetical protein